MFKIFFSVCSWDFSMTAYIFAVSEEKIYIKIIRDPSKINGAVAIGIECTRYSISM